MKQLLSILGLGVALYLLYSNTVKAPKQPINSSPVAQQEQAFDYVMEQLVIREYQANGALSSKLVSPNLKQLTGQSIAVLDKPQLSIARASSEQWQLTADIAEFDQLQQQMLFKHNVRLFQPQARFLTEQLTVDLTTDILKLADGVKAEYAY